MRLKIAHTTTYQYDQPVAYALQRVRLRPASSVMQEVLDWSLAVEGGKVETGYSDHYGNLVDLICADEGTRALSIRVEGTVETHDRAGILGRVYGRAPLWHFQRATALTEAGPQISGIAHSVDKALPQLDRLHALSAAILDAVAYTPDETHPETTAEEAVAHGHGVCQDHANIFIAAARYLGFPVRYVSGYLQMDDRIDQDASHAWAEAHVDDLGWVGFDVSNGISPDERYVRLATGRDAHDAAPVSGLRMGPGDESLIVSLQVQQ
ncbi:transglutaminase domain-containing protein [Marimonas sp. MJW-29]|uniref:Transglutaminase domain-containing protein n=1 Tax=Sulfitobacter sediminis TaxID=3234186 RepID=A0ABV3RQU4_9RHOB